MPAGSAFEELVRVILATDENELLELLSSHFDGPKGFEYVRALVTGIHQVLESGKEHEEKMEMFRFKLVETVIELFGNHRLQNQSATKLTSTIVGLVEQLDAEGQVELCVLIVKNFQEDPSCFQACLFLPTLLSSILHQGADVFYEGQEVSPDVFRAKYFELLCSLKWDSAVAIPFCEMFRDLSLSEKELIRAIQKLSEAWGELPPSGTPCGSPKPSPPFHKGVQGTNFTPNRFVLRWEIGCGR